MKSFIVSFAVAFLMMGCSQSTPKSAFTGTAEKHETAPVGTISDQSIFMVTDSFQTQQNKSITLASLQGKPTIVGMIFTNCTYACPRLTADMQQLETKLKDDDGKINYVLISFDAERDQPEQLKKFAGNLNLGNNWTLLHGSEDAVRTLSVLLNVQFEKDAEGNFSHSNIISVLDKNGVLRYQKEGLNADQSETLATIRQLAQ
jgi:protein SCO1